VLILKKIALILLAALLLTSMIPGGLGRPAAAAGANMIANPGFETDLSGWTANGGGVISRNEAEKHGGAASVKVERPSRYNGNVMQSGLSFEPGKSYYFSAWIKREAGSGQIALYVNQPNVTWNGGTSFPQMATGNIGTTWVNLRGIKTFPTEQTSQGSPYIYNNASFFVQHVSAGSDGTGPFPAFYVDDIVVEPAMPQSLVISGENSIAIPNAGNPARILDYNASAFNQMGTEEGMADPAIAWSIEGDFSGVSIDASTGMLAVTDAAAAGTVTVHAASVDNPSASASFHVSLYAEPTVNMIRNPGFETDLQGWNSAGGAVLSRDTAIKNSGAASAKVSRTVGYNGNIGQDNFAFEPGETYYFSAMVRRETGTGSISFYLNQPNIKWNGGSSYPQMANSNVGTSWTRLAGIRTFPTAATSGGQPYVYDNARLFFQHTSAGNDGSGPFPAFYVDDVFVSIAMPSSLEITGAASVEIPLNGNSVRKYSYSAILKNQLHTTEGMEDEAVTWTLEGDYPGVGINSATGQLSVADSAAASTLRIQAAAHANPQVKAGLTVTLTNITPEATPTAPVASNVVVEGKAKPGRTVTGVYDYEDANGDHEAGTNYNWYISDSAGGTPTLIPGQNGRDYVVSLDDVGKYLQFGVTPATTVAPETGTQAFSESVQVTENHAPAATDVSIAGMPTVGETLEGVYAFADEDDDKEAGSTYRWLQSDTRSGVYSPIPGAAGRSLTLTEAQLHQYVRFEVAPADAISQGEPYMSLPSERIEATMPSEFYVDPALGNDDHEGSLEKPFRTIARARDKVRAISDGMTSDITVYLRGGTYTPEYTLTEQPLYNRDNSLSEILQVKESELVFDERDSGKNGFYVRYAAFPGEEPTIAGGRVIDGWTLHDAQNNIYKAPSGGNLDTRQLYVNGERAVRARSEAGLAQAVKTATGVTTTDTFLAGWSNVKDIEMVFQEKWTSPRCGVEAIAVEQGLAHITMQQPCWSYASDKGATSATVPWYYENAYELLDQPGEWYLDADGEYFYYKPRPGESMEAAEVIAPELETLLTIRGSSLDHKAVRLSFEGIRFEYTTWLRPSSRNGLSDAQNSYIREPGVSSDILALGAVNVSNANEVVFSGNQFTHLGSIALRTTDGVQDSLVVGNRFVDIAGSAIAIGEVSELQRRTNDPRDLNRNNDVLNNYISHIGQDYYSSAAISAGYAVDMDIRHNEIGHIPYSGLHIGYGWASNAFSNTKNVRIQNNLIYDAMQVLNDGAQIYALGRTGGSPENPSIVSGNYLLRNHSHSQGALYFDEGSNYWDVYDNVIEDAPAYIFIWTNTIHDIHADNLYTNTPSSRNNGINTIIKNTQLFENAVWPTEALDIIRQAGLELAYHGLRPQEEIARLFIRELPLEVGQQGQIEVVSALTDSGYTVANVGDSAVFSSLNPEVAIIDAAGKVTAVGPGEATIMASVDGKSVPVANKIYVEDELAALTIEAPKTVIGTGFMMKVEALAITKYGQKLPLSSVTFESLNPETATVDAAGKVTGISPGYAEIRATGLSRGEMKTGQLLLQIVEESNDDFINKPEYWYVDGIGEVEGSPGVVEITTPAGFATYQGTTFLDESLQFRMQIKDTGGWHSLYLRSQEYDEDYNGSSNSNYIFVFAAGGIELHRFNNGQRTVIYGNLAGFLSVAGDAIPNHYVKYGVESLVEVSAVNRNEGVQITLKIDGETVIDFMDTADAAIKERGYFGVHARTGTVVLRSVERPSVDLRLTELYVDGKAVSGFSPDHTGPYQAKVAHEVTKVDISYTASNPGVTVEIAGNEQLAVGDNTIVITVKGLNEESRTYTVVIRREAAASNGGGGIIVHNDSIVETTNGILHLPAGRAGRTSLPGDIVIDIPSGATTKPVRFTVEKETEPYAADLPKGQPVSPVFVLTSDEPEAFVKPLEVAITLDRTQVKVGQQPSVFYYNEVTKEWKKLGGEVDGDRIAVQIDRIDPKMKLVVMVDEESPGESGQKFFSDIAGHWAESLVSKAVQMRMVNGYPNGEFRPDAAISRAEFVVMLMNALKSGNVAGDGAELTFTDAIDPWARAAITQAVQSGIVNGYRDGSFRPRANITRSELAVMMARAAGVAELASSTAGFSDDKDIPAWAKGAVAYLKETGIVEGRSGNRFAPGAIATRAEAVAVILRLLEAIEVE
jgi:hypothetical protein